MSSVKNTQVQPDVYFAMLFLALDGRKLSNEEEDAVMMLNRDLNRNK